LNNRIEINDTKIKGGFISDVIDVHLYLEDNTLIKCICKLENANENCLTKMSYDLDLYGREYYFYNNLSRTVPIKTPKFIGLIKNELLQNIGVLLENVNNSEHILNLNLNNEDVSVSLKVIENIAKLHSAFWDKCPDYINVKKNNDPLFNPSWNKFVKEKWQIFKNKWQHTLTSRQYNITDYIYNNFTEIQEKLSDKNLTLCHGDVKSANIFYKIKNDSYEPVFIDWQYITFGKGVQDLVFFMIESFEPCKMRIYKELFKEHYYQQIINSGINYSRNDYNNDFVNATYYFPFFVAIWFGTLNEDELIDKSFPSEFISRLFNLYDNNQ